MYKYNKVLNKLKKIQIITIICTIFALIFNFNCAKAITLEPTPDQKIEYRAVSLEKKENGNQLIIEVWIHELNFKGIDLRLEYDPQKLQTSNIATNEVIDVNSELSLPRCFEFANDFDGYLDYFVMSLEEGEYRGVLSILGEDERTKTNEYLVQDEQRGDYVSISDTVLLGRLSFNVGELTSQDITSETLKLKPATTSPTTGVKVSIDGENSYEAESLFEFTLSLASNNAYLTSIESDSFTIDNFDKNNFNYEIKIGDVKDKITITPTLENEKATITYNAGQIENKMPFEVTLNPVGEDTIVQIIVISEDKSVTNTYTIVIKLAVGTITGKIQLGNGLRESMEESYGTTTKYIADISFYNTGSFNWDGIIPGESKLEDLDNIEKIASTTSDDEGNYTIYLKPGTYDCIIERKGFLVQVFKNITILEYEKIDLGNKILIEGDCNRSGSIDLDDMIDIVNFSGLSSTDEGYEERYDYGQKGFIGLDDLVSTTTNMYKTATIEEYEK